MNPGGQTTGTRDERYDLVSVLYHALHAAETIETYVLDAEASGDERLASFFREAQATHVRLAERAKVLLGILEAPPEGTISPGGMSGGITPDASSEEGGIAPDTISGGIPPPRSADERQRKSP